MTEKFQILLCTNGDEASQPALAYGIWLAELLQASVHLLGIVENPQAKPALEALLEEIAGRLEEKKIPVRREIDSGRGSVVIARHTEPEIYLTVVGRLGRPAWRRFVQGRSFRRLLRQVESPILYVPEGEIPLKHLLICMGGLGYAEGVVRLGAHLAQASGARVTVLHVVEPASLEYPTAREVQDHKEKILDSDTPQARNLKTALNTLVAAGLQVDLKVRYGNIVHEILQEVREGDYTMVGLGSPYSAQSLRHLFLPNVTAEVAEALNLPVLTVRYGHDLLEEGDRKD